MLHPLRPAPSHAPRPNITDDAVLVRALDVRRTEIAAWADAKGHAMSDEAVQFAGVISLRKGMLDGFRAARLMADVFGVPADHKLVSLLQEAVTATPYALRSVTREWAVKTGMRVPAKSGDTIVWLNAEGEPREGVVEEVDRGLCVAYVRVGDPDPDTGQFGHVRVDAEQITSNPSQARYDLEEPVLGATYAPEDVARYVAEEAARAAGVRAAQGIATAPAPQGANNSSRKSGVPSPSGDDFPPTAA